MHISMQEAETLHNLVQSNVQTLLNSLRQMKW